MAKETSSANDAKQLHEVLEAEFVALHDKLPPNYPSSSEPETRLKELRFAVHEEKHAALCISGGGIRSATFGLGILQGLARYGLLDSFHYLSTVSGGGYIGSWLSAWIKNHPQGIGGVVAELNSNSSSNLDPEPEPIRQLREFSNYLTPRTGLMSVDFWTLIATFIRNMFLNWLVLISWLAAAIMIPRFYLASINVEPNWSTWKGPVPHYWDIGLTIVLAYGFALVAIAMAYAIIDVPSTGKARFSLSQRHFLIFRQLPLLLASLILAAWWAVFRNVHGSEPFQPGQWLFKFIGFTVACYLSGGLIAACILFFRKREQKAQRTRLVDWLRGHVRSVLRLATIVLTAVFAGFCLWAMAMHLFLGPSGREFELKSECEAILIPSLQKVRLSTGTQVKKIRDKGEPSAKNKYKFTRESDADQIPSGENMKIRKGDRALFAREDFDALKPINDVPAPAKHALNYVCFAPALLLAVLLLVNFLFTGLASRVTKDEDREWWSRSAAWILITISGWIVFNAMDLWGAQALGPGEAGNQLQVFVSGPQANEFGKAILGAFGGVTGIAGALLALRHKLGSKLRQKGVPQGLLVAVAVLFFVLLSIVISCVIVVIRSRPWMQSASRWLLLGNVNDLNSWRLQLFIAFFLTAVLLSFGIVMGFFIDANKFSLHATYRNRLIRAYLAASRKKRSPNKFTGFDPGDDFELHKLCSQKPLHIINAALNRVHGEELARQERKAESFTMSPLFCGSHCGSMDVGYRRSSEYGNGITLGTALAISGAAANPNMGYHSSPIVGFLMTLFNVRLGWWLGNPGPPGAKTWRRSGPRYSVGPLFSEALGKTTNRCKYVNLSDGGHFENLGLYEMVLRRCHYIVVSDAGEDPECSFADLGEAVRKIRIDFGIPIEFEPMTIYPRSAIDSLKSANQKGHNCAIGRIRYSVVDGDAIPDGVIVYIKPACYGDEPRDIYEYFKKSLTFPHESTADQFFSESQFESYRMLGAHTIEGLCTHCDGDFRTFDRDASPFCSFVNVIFGSHLQTEVPQWLKGLIQPAPNASGSTGAV
jgi:hypothetical protein